MQHCFGITTPDAGIARYSTELARYRRMRSHLQSGIVGTMSRVLPSPPEGVQLSHAPALSVDDAVDWYLGTLGIEVTPRYLKAQTDAGELHCQIICGKRRYATVELWRFIVTRPGHTKAKAVTS
jgi:hypothetical protein